MLITKRRSNSILPPPLVLDNNVLQQVYTYRYLGVTLSSDLSWRPHITAVCKKTKRLVGLVHRRFSAHASPDALVLLYKSFVRPHLEYASAAWSPYHKGEIKQLESIQKFALKVCLKAWNNSVSYDSMLEMSGLRSLECRRKIARVCHLFKVIFELTHFPNNDIHPRVTTHHTRNLTKHSLDPIVSRTYLYKNSFVPATIELWNNVVMQVEMEECESLRTFKFQIFAVI